MSHDHLAGMIQGFGSGFLICHAMHSAIRIHFANKERAADEKRAAQARNAR